MTDKTITIRIPSEMSSASLVEGAAIRELTVANGVIIKASDMDEPMGEFQATGNAFWDDEDYRRFRPYNVVRAADGTGVLVISIRGSLLPDFPYQAGTWATGYQYITEAAVRAMNDSTIRSVVLMGNSGGGSVRECFECGLSIAALAKVKPVIAYAGDMMASAAYWLASQASEIHISPTGEVGSIGVITGHMDFSEELKMWGVKYTPLFAGERKADGSPYLPLSDEAKAGIQRRLNAIYAEFISAVALGRGIDEDEIRETQAAMFASKESVRRKLADKVSTKAEVMAVAFGMKTAITADENNDEGSDMTDKTKQTEAVAPTPVTAADTPVTPAPVADSKAAVAEAMARVQEILGCEQAKGREAQANVFAFKTDLSVDAVKELLAAASVTAAPAPAPADANAFLNLMNGTQNPDVPAAGGADAIDPLLAAALGQARK